MNLRCDVLRAATAGGQRSWEERLALLPPVRVRPCRHLVVLTTHLDEDVCAAGGLIARLAERAVSVDVLAVTDGNGVPAGSPGAASARPAARRLTARRLAYERLGARDVRFDALALTCGKVRDERVDVIAALSEIVGFAADPSAVWVLAPWRGDGQDDHIAVSEAAGLVAHVYGAELIEYVVTAWTTRRPDDPVWESARTFALSPAEQARKRHAVDSTVDADAVFRVGEHELYFTAR